MSHGAAFWLVNYVQPIGTISIGIAGFFIARRQWRISNDKFRFDLFEKRFKVYETASAELGLMLRVGEDNIDIMCIERLEGTIIEARLFFGQAVSASLQDATVAARRLWSIRNGGIDYRFRTETLDLQDRLLHKIVKAATDTTVVMKNFIDFSDVGRPFYFSKLWRYRRVLINAVITLRHRIRSAKSSV